MKPIFLLIGATALAGCATMNADQCASADWRAYGHQDGAAGRPASMANKRAEACFEHGVTLDHAAYEAGRNQGLWTWCTPARGFDLGASGARYDGVCVDHDESAFLAAFDEGATQLQFTSAVGRAQESLSSASSEVASITATLSEYASGNRDFEADGHNEKVLSLWSKRKYLQQEAIPYWQVELRVAERELDGYRARVAAGDPNAGVLTPRSVSGPKPYAGPTQADAREMVAEVFAQAFAGAKKTQR